MQPEISIITPVYNAQLFLDKCVQSILKQTFENIELLLINDGSTDQSANICEFYERQDKRVRVISQDNKGVAIARNTGLQYATGRYIAWVDSDDWIDLDYIEILKKASGIEDFPVIVVNNDEFVKKNEILEGEKIILSFLEGHLPSCMWSTLIPRECYRDLSFKNFRVGEDSMMLIDIFSRIEKLKCIYNRGYHYETNPNSLTRLKKRETIQSWIDEVKAQKDLILKRFPFAQTKMCYRSAMFSFDILNNYCEPDIVKNARMILSDSLSHINFFKLSKHEIKELLKQIVKSKRVLRK